MLTIHLDTIQKSITNDPNSIAAEAGQSDALGPLFLWLTRKLGGNIDTAAIITNLKSTISMQQADIERLQAKLAQVTKEREEEVGPDLSTVTTKGLLMAGANLSGNPSIPRSHPCLNDCLS